MGAVVRNKSSVSSIQSLAVANLAAREIGEAERAKHEADQRRIAINKLNASAAKIAEER